VVVKLSVGAGVVKAAALFLFLNRGRAVSSSAPIAAKMLTAENVIFAIPGLPAGVVKGSHDPAEIMK
jgi:hypothetical protein